MPCHRNFLTVVSREDIYDISTGCFGTLGILFCHLSCPQTGATAPRSSLPVSVLLYLRTALAARQFKAQANHLTEILQSPAAALSSGVSGIMIGAGLSESPLFRFVLLLSAGCLSTFHARPDARSRWPSVWIPKSRFSPGRKAPAPDTARSRTRWLTHPLNPIVIAFRTYSVSFSFNPSR